MFNRLPGGEDGMTRVLEDLFRGPLASPSFSQELRFCWEDSRWRVRVFFGEIAMADSTSMSLVHEFSWLCVFSFPLKTCASI
jgi:hypothetical protein